MFAIIKYTFLNHVRNIVFTLGNLYRKPFYTSTIVFIIGVTLALPILGFMLVQSLEDTYGRLNQQAELHIYLDHDLSDEQTHNLQQEISNIKHIAKITYISKEESLAALDHQLGESLIENPLPNIFSVKIDHPKYLTEQLTENLSSLPGVNMLNSDNSWIKNYVNIVDTIKIIVTVFGILIVFTMSIIMVNTINLLLEHKQTHIRINRLMGATLNFIFREFMYYGFWYGCFGAILAILLASTSLLIIKIAVSKIFNDASIIPYYLLNIKHSIFIVSSTSVLGTLSAIFSITKQIQKIENTG